MHLRLTAAVAAIGFLSAAPACAAEPKPDAFYLSLSLGQARQAQREPNRTDNGLARLAVGYNFNKGLAVEVFSEGYLFGSLWILRVPSRPEPTYLADEYTGIAAIGAVSLGESWRLRGRLGVGRTKAAMFAAQSGDFVGNTNRTDPSVGVGLAFDPSAHWTLSLDAGRLTRTKVDTIAFGVQYRF